ncbi:MAG: envelope stress response membrane protein PspB [Pseudomonadota bacterium]|nr:envelope stress response membrane protein PspB [Pseudomonadota bacterium]
MEETIVPIIVVGILFLGLPWIVLHYVSKWKTAATLTTEDENLLDELHDLARRLDERMCTIERIVQAENPNWRSIACDPMEPALEDRTARILEADRANRAARRN